MRRITLLIALILLSAPMIALAQNQDGQGQNGQGQNGQGGDDPYHRHIAATEMAAAGTGAAFLIGATGYLLLRRKKLA